jgi:hypothetical protein
MNKTDDTINGVRLRYLYLGVKCGASYVLSDTGCIEEKTNSSLKFLGLLALIAIPVVCNCDYILDYFDSCMVLEKKTSKNN